MSLPQVAILKEIFWLFACAGRAQNLARSVSVLENHKIRDTLLLHIRNAKKLTIRSGEHLGFQQVSQAMVRYLLPVSLCQETHANINTQYNC